MFKHKPNTLAQNDDPTKLEPRPDPAPVTSLSNSALSKLGYQSGAAGNKIFGKEDPGAAPLATDSEADDSTRKPQFIGNTRGLDGVTALRREDAGLAAGPRDRLMVIFALLFLLIILVGVCALTWAIFQHG
jgi:hypothetical protein